MPGSEGAATGHGGGARVAAGGRPAAFATRWRPPPALVLAVLFGAGLVLSGFTLLREIGPHDEGLMLQAAQRIADGQLPYRDFWWNYGPGQPYLLALPTELFGPSLLWWRLLRVALDALVAVLAYVLVRRACAPHELRVPSHGRTEIASRRLWLPLLAWLAVAGAMAFPTGPGPNPAALALVGGALLLVGRRPALAGALCGAAIVFRPEIGGAGALALLALGGGLRSLAWAVGVAIAALLPLFAAAPGDMLEDTVGFLGIQDLQRLPFPLSYDDGADPNKLLEFYLPAILVAGTAAWGAWAALRRPRWALAAAPLLLVGLLYLLGRPDEFHLVPLSVVLAAALAVAAAREPAAAWRAGLVALLALIALHGVERRAGQLLHPPPLADVPSPVADGVQTSPADAAALAGLLPRIHALTPDGEPIFVAPPRFDRVSVGDPLLYVLAQRPNPTRYDVMQPGVVTTAEVQREIVADLERTEPPVLVRWLDPRAAADEPNASSASSGVTILDDHLRGSYGEPERFGPYELSRRLAP